MSMYQHGGNSHDRRKAARKERFLMAYDYRPSEPLKHESIARLPMGVRAGKPGQHSAALDDAETIMRAEGVFLKIKAEKPFVPHPTSHHPSLRDVPLPVSQPAGFQFIEGASVRNKRTKSVATMLERGGNQILVKRRDNRSVYWPLEECENWNV